MPPSARDLDLDRLHALKDAVAPVVAEAGRWARALAARHHAGEDVLGVHAKTSPGDVVTVADAEVQRRLAAALAALLPGAGMVGEEGLDAPAPGAPVWVIDPIDGTHNYVRGAGAFCVSVGLVADHESVLGVIYDAEDDAVYWALRGGGAWRGGERLHGPAPRAFDHALVATNFTSDSARLPRDQATYLAIARASAGVRSSGAACHDFCRYAAGRIDLFWQLGLKSWDVAAGAVLVREAGGACTFVDAPADWVRAPGLATFAGQPDLVAQAVATYRAAT